VTVPTTGQDRAPAFSLRKATVADVPVLERIIAASARGLSREDYSEAQIETALQGVFGVDSELIRDGTYFVAEAAGAIVACGGWSRRKTLFGGDRGRSPLADPLLDPKRDAARIRAFFVHPACARQGVGRLLMSACERAAAEAGFRAMELVATLAGEPLYAAFAFCAVERYDVALANGLSLPVVRMAKALPAST